MEYKKTYKLRLNAEQCRKILRLDLQYNFAGVTKSEIDENNFQINGLAYKTGSFWDAGFAQVLSVRLTQNAEDNSTNVIIKAVPTIANAHGDKWQNALEQLVGIVWNDIYRAADSRYPNANTTTKPQQKVQTVQVEDNLGNADESCEAEVLKNAQEDRYWKTSESDYGGNSVSQTQQQQQAVAPQNKYKKYKKFVYIGIAVVVAIIFFTVILPALTGGGKKTYTYNSSTGVSIEMTLDGGYDRGSYSLKVYNPNVYGRNNTYTGNYWSNGTTVNGYENFAITGYESSRFYISTDRKTLVIDCKTGNGNLSITYTLTLQ